MPALLEPRLERIAERYRERLPVYRAYAERDMVERLDGLIREDDFSDALDRATGA